MKNRRNYYRVLHVQPDAPEAVIKATYRTLMQKLKMHPDLGGDTWNAALVNEAYAVLSNIRRREEYDLLVMKSLQQRNRQDAENTTEASCERGYCPFCKTTFLVVPGNSANDACLECRSPLQGMDSQEMKVGLQRIAARIEKSFEITYYTYWPQLPKRAIARNFSPTGIAMVAADDFFIGQVVKIESTLLRAVAQVKNFESVDSSSPHMKVGLKYMTASFDLPTGTFVAVTI